MNRKTEHKIIMFHHKYPNCCICDIVNDRCESAMYLEPNDLKHYKIKCDKCGYLKYDGPMYSGVCFAMPS